MHTMGYRRKYLFRRGTYLSVLKNDIPNMKIDIDRIGIHSYFHRREYLFRRQIYLYGR